MERAFKNLNLTDKELYTIRTALSHYAYGRTEPLQFFSDRMAAAKLCYKLDLKNRFREHPVFEEYMNSAKEEDTKARLKDV